ncbi:hypothetical protein BS47DRAFT_1343748 [Hydnum rufescens UP504]|uniref:Exoribonuclease phosphorolytic domain-containing protein n=1 Tax=Hydnum rufescens UP504 TaxID=1448309 RepID=A0A9P6AXY4_9AGAM|nr:hypothetical protein BS47DRAFT_1343748 [Hydnum rufescens UP504]
MRPMSLQWAGLSRADGGARFAFGRTEALASVSGPIEVRLTSEYPSRATLDVIVRPLVGVPGTCEKLFGKRLQQVFEQVLLLNQHPRTLVQVVLQSLSSSPPPGSAITGSVAATLINVTSLALLHAASIPMRGVVCAVAVGKERITGNLVLDPDPLRMDQESIGCFGFLFSESNEPQAVWTDWTGRFGQEYHNALNLSRSGALLVVESLRRSLQTDSMDIS